MCRRVRPKRTRVRREIPDVSSLDDGLSVQHWTEGKTVVRADLRRERGQCGLIRGSSCVMDVEQIVERTAQVGAADLDSAMVCNRYERFECHAIPRNVTLHNAMYCIRPEAVQERLGPGRRWLGLRGAPTRQNRRRRSETLLSGVVCTKMPQRPLWLSGAFLVAPRAIFEQTIGSELIRNLTSEVQTQVSS